MKKMLCWILLLCLVLLSSDGAEAPKKFEFGSQPMADGDGLLASFSVHAKVYYQKQSLGRMLYSNRQPLPDYPVLLLKAGIAGSAEVSFTIRPDGSVADVVIIQQTQPEFADAAKSAVEKWQFASPILDGKPIKLSAKARFLFSLYQE